MKRKVNVDKMRNTLGASTFSYRGGVFTFRRSYFYRHGGTTEKYVSRVKSVYPNAVILDSGDVWKAFRGGASVANQSHWFVKFTFPRLQVPA